MRNLIFLIMTLVIFSCAQKDFAGKNVFYRGIQLYKEGKYSEAKDLLKKSIYKVQGLTADELMKARFYLADSYYREEQYVDAIVEFEELITLFPTAPFMDEALYKLADSYLKISPGVDRDMTYPEKALEKAEELIDSYPESKYVEKAKKIIYTVNKMKADHLLEIADLYEKLGKFYSASRYYQLAHDQYGDYINRAFVEYKLAYNLLRTKDQYDKEIKEYKEKIITIQNKIREEKNLEKKNVLINRKKVLEKHLSRLEDRIKKSYERGKSILQYIVKNYKGTEYEKKALNLLKKFTEVNNH
ncbi:outer membrane protein assembly factor BamD [Persephonella sp.]